ncbi:MAG: 2-succinyl-5-enolpyruvyl-6-hydroxy-3-cyclohexene-1-carboxylic-acid synthase [Cyclobacteriaceae bacterium]
MNSTIYNISEVFAVKGISRVVLSPGSRNAPLTISFARNPKIQTFNIVDERSAAFIALGMSIRSKEPVAICCTSGTALLNYAPAVAEAYYQNIPLIVLSADRPPEWLDQRDGQTINQPGALSNFVKGSFELPVDLEHDDAKWEWSRKLNEALNLAHTPPFGPVHINVPFREPFYPEQDQPLKFENVRTIDDKQLPVLADYSSLIPAWNSFKKRLIVVGQNDQNEELFDALNLNSNLPVLTDIISNLTTGKFVKTQDLFLGNLNEEQLESLRPELLITTGKSLISKNLKLFIRKYKPKAHWHFEDCEAAADTFKTLTKHLKHPLAEFLNAVADQRPDNEFKDQVIKNYKQNWETIESRTRAAIETEVETQGFSELTAYYDVLNQTPSGLDIHLANSMAVRYANFFHYKLAAASIFSNRGTSGIDGSNGTAVGSALCSGNPTLLLTGDLSFFYDRNAFFHQYDLSNLKIIVFNNFGGGIFRLIKGPSGLEELEQHFETRHTHSAKFTAAEYAFDYFRAKDSKSLNEGLKLLFKDNKTPKILEVFSDPNANSDAFSSLKKVIVEALKTK